MLLINAHVKLSGVFGILLMNAVSHMHVFGALLANAHVTLAGFLSRSVCILSRRQW